MLPEMELLMEEFRELRKDFKESHKDMKACMDILQKTITTMTVTSNDRFVRIESFVNPLRKFGWTVIILVISPWFKGCV